MIECWAPVLAKRFSGTCTSSHELYTAYGDLQYVHRAHCHCLFATVQSMLYCVNIAYTHLSRTLCVVARFKSAQGSSFSLTVTAILSCCFVC